MPRLTRTERETIAHKRIISVLRTQGVVNLRTLEHKIADAGPNPQRVQPHILTPVKTRLVQTGRIIQINRSNAQWLHLSNEDTARVRRRMDELTNIQSQFSSRSVIRRTGQALEISVFRALLSAPDIVTIGGFSDLDEHDDEQLFRKEEIRTLNGRTIGNRALDFVISVKGYYCGIEVKNIRPWLYLHDKEVRDAIGKSRTLGLIPIIIARRIPFVTFRILGTCGVIIHENYNQLMANTDAEIAAQAKHKNKLGYHDIRVGNHPDQRMTRFVTINLPNLVEEAQNKLDKYGDLLDAFAEGMAYQQFAAHVRQRQQGQNKDQDWEDEEDEEDESI